MKRDTYKLRVADAEKLTEDVRSIYSKIKVFEDEHKIKIAPLKDEIEKLEQSFFDKYLIDSAGKPVKKGMTVEKDGKRYRVLDRYQQCLFAVLRQCESICFTRR